MACTLYHNPRCSKSRATLDLLRAHGVEPTIIEYLVTPLDAATLRRLLTLLGLSAHALARRGEEAWRTVGLNDDSSEDAIIAAMVAHPVLIERPIVVCGERAVIGRPPERVLELLG